MHEYPCPEPVTVDISQGAGTLQVIAEERDTATVEVTPWDHSESSARAAERTKVEMFGDRLRVEAPESTSTWLPHRAPKVRLAVRVPLDCALRVKVASADARCAGRYASAEVASASGDVAVEHVTGDTKITTSSGDVLVDRGDGQVSVKSASADVTVTLAGGPVTAHTASGNVTVDEALDSVRLNTASGDLRVGRAARGTVKLHSASGGLSVGVVTGTLVWLDVTTWSGSTRCDLSTGDTTPADREPDLRLHMRSASGDIEIYRVPQGTAAPVAA
jgi:DUF4097 and DUF4098 domain-containing protein YvlB